MRTKGKPSEVRPWMKYYPGALIENLSIPECTLLDYLKRNCPGEDVTAIHYYGEDISWKTLFAKVTATARSLRMLNFKEGDQIPVFFKAVPEVIYLLLAAEMIGASLLCRDNTLEENAEAVRVASAKIIFAHDYLSQQDFNAFKKMASVELAILLPPVKTAQRAGVPRHINRYIAQQYPEYPVYGPQTLTWDQFLKLGKNFKGRVEASIDIHRPLFRAYTSGSTGPSKQVIHSANTIIGNIHQMNFYGSSDDFRPIWLMANLPPALIAVVVAMILLPLASNKLLILDPFCDPKDIDLEMMRYRPNCWPMIPMFIEIIMRSKRIPKNYDMSHLLSSGAGAESLNNKQFRRIQAFLKSHNCDIRFTTGYGSSEAGSNMTLPMTPHKIENGNIGIPMPLNVMGIFEPGTQNEFGYGQYGEICCCAPSLMLSYGNPIESGMALKRHDDGLMWLHTGDMGYMNEDGVIYAINRGNTMAFDGTELMLLPMENAVADLNIEGIEDEFFVFVPDREHEGYFVPDLFIVLNKGYSLKDVEKEVRARLGSEVPVDKVFQIKKRPFFHFKTNRLMLRKMVLDGAEDFSEIFAGEEETEEDAQDAAAEAFTLTPEQKKLFSYFMYVRGMGDQLADVLDNDRRCTDGGGTSKTGNLLITGEKGTGKTVLGVNVVKAILKQRNIVKGKAAIVKGDTLNRKKLADIIDRLYGGALIIEKASKMNERTVYSLNKAMEGDTGGLLVILEDQGMPLDRLLLTGGDFRRRFTGRLEVPDFTNDELVTFGQIYAKENGYRINDSGMLALYGSIDEMQSKDHAVTISEVKDMIDEAIEAMKVSSKIIGREGFQIKYKKMRQDTADIEKIQSLMKKIKKIS